MLSGIGREPQDTALGNAIESIALGRSQLVQHVTGICLAARLIVPRNATKPTGPIKKANAGKRESADINPARKQYTKNLAGHVSVAAYLILEFLRLTTSTLQKRCALPACNTQLNGVSFFGKRKYLAVICKYFAQIVTASKHTNKAGPEKAPAPVQEGFEL